MENKSIIKTKYATCIIPKEIGLKGLELIGHARFRDAFDSLEKHTHKQIIEICYLHTGQQIYTVADTEYIIYGGDVFITFPNEIHDTGNSPQEKSELYWLQINIESNENLLGLNSKQSAMLVDALKGLFNGNRHFKGSNILKKHFDDFFHYFEECCHYKNLKLSNTIITLLLNIIDLQKKSIKNYTSDIASAIDYIENNIKDNIDIKTLADITYLSASRFKQKFKEQTGFPPIEYIRYKKIKLAKELLKNRASTITQVSFELDFCTSQFFSRTFKKYTGLTPSEFRNSLKNTNNS